MIGETIRSQNGFHRTWKQAVRTSDEIQCDRLGTECGNSQSEVQTTMNQYGEWRMHKGGTKKSAEEKSKKDFGTQNDTWYLLRRVWQFWTQLAKKTESEVISQQVYKSFWGVALVIQIMQWLIFLSCKTGAMSTCQQEKGFHHGTQTHVNDEEVCRLKQKSTRCLRWLLLVALWLPVR